MKILLIAGHGAGDTGASGCGYKETNLTRELVNLIAPTVIFLWGSAEAQGVDLVKHTIFRPHKHLPFFPGEMNCSYFSTRSPR